jgi:LysM repeat protein
MSERGLPAEGAPACPFVAFEDDRDGRATAPDHGHRCFAEPRPAPRALAHQEAYCLSSAFPVCPTFQDWARREAAAARPTATGQGATRDELPGSQPVPPLEREPRRSPTGSQPPVAPPRRPPHRDWAAPPPWAGEDASGAAAGLVAGAAAGAAMNENDDDRYAPAGGDDRYAPPRDPAPAPSRASDDYGADSRGLAGSSAHRLAGPDPDEPLPARPTGGHVEDDDLDQWAAGAAGAATAGAAGASRATQPPLRYEPAPRPDGRPQGATTGRDDAHRPEQQDAQELFGPAWERPRRYEAYPSLRTRMGLRSMGGLPRIAIWGLLLLLAALLLFLFGPSLLGLGKSDHGASGASPTPVVTEQPGTSLEPTAPPAPTPQVYVVAKGDTMSKIAKRFGLTMAEVMAANPQIKNPDKIAIGDQMTIPVPVGDGGGAASGGTVPSAESATP